MILAQARPVDHSGATIAALSQVSSEDVFEYGSGDERERVEVVHVAGGTVYYRRREGHPLGRVGWMSAARFLYVVNAASAAA